MASRRSRDVILTGEDKLLSVLKVTGSFEQAREEEECQLGEALHVRS